MDGQLLLQEVCMCEGARHCQAGTNRVKRLARVNNGNWVALNEMS